MSAAPVSAARLRSDLIFDTTSNCSTWSYAEPKAISQYGGRLDAEFSARNHMSDRSIDGDPVFEQIERNRKLADQLSPVLKYKEMMKKCRSRAAPRRKFSIAQGYPRVVRWKSGPQSKSLAKNCSENSGMY
ncbi:unnamed protein product [Nippostrongylus brasiliensis]|uniref:Uncharacterized protein n=1 Tax=Nippostrongylus brasiliensis TaxID=27835 RepID=A0A0N4YRM9_NIPBR|nr:unnamed protein product [Nippostrongylus brasiliensis]